jgi:hypothetical protein
MIRQTFENWYSDGGKFPRAIERSGDGYQLKHAHDAWTSWQIASAATAEKCASMAENCPPEVTMFGDHKRCPIPRAIAGAIRKSFGLSD